MNPPNSTDVARALGLGIRGLPWRGRDYSTDIHALLLELDKRGFEVEISGSQARGYFAAVGRTTFLSDTVGPCPTAAQALATAVVAHKGSAHGRQ